MITLVLIGVASGIALLSVPAIQSWQRRYKEVRLLTGHRREHLHALWYGNFDEVRAALNDTDDANQMFVRACAELEAGDCETAEDFAGHISADDPAVKVLVNLIARRKSRPDEVWLDALEHSWQSAYRPSLLGNKFANSDLVSSHLDAWEGDVLDGTDHVLWTAMSVKTKITGAVYPREVRLWAMASDAGERDLGELIITNNLIALDTFGDGTPRMLVNVRDRLNELAPENLWVRLGHCIAHEDRAALRPTDVDALAQCIDAPSVDATLGGAAIRRFDAVGDRAKVPHPIVASQHASNLCVLLLPLQGLWHRLGETRSYSLRQRAAEILVQLSRRMREDRTVFSAVAAYETMRQANTVLMSARLAGELEARHVEHRHFLSIAGHLVLNPYAWPIPSLVHEAAAAERDNELEFYRRHLGDPNAALPQAWLIQR